MIIVATKPHYQRILFSGSIKELKKVTPNRMLIFIKRYGYHIRKEVSEDINEKYHT